MNKIDVLSKVYSIISHLLSVDIDEISKATYLKDVGADSLDEVELIMKFEKEFCTSIEDREVCPDNETVSINEIVNIICKNLNIPYNKNNYSSSVINDAKKLYNNHYNTFSHQNSIQIRKQCAIKASIVTCNFLLDNKICQDSILGKHFNQIKSYLGQLI